MGAMRLHATVPLGCRTSPKKLVQRGSAQASRPDSWEQLNCTEEEGGEQGWVWAPPL